MLSKATRNLNPFNWKMNVRIIGQSPPPFGGVAIHVANLNKILNKIGIDADIIFKPKKGQQSPALQQIHKWSVWLKLIFQMLVVRKPNFHDHLFFSILTSKQFFLYCLVYYLMAIKGNVVATLHSGGFFDTYGNTSWIKKSLFGHTLRRFKSVIVDSEKLAAELSAIGVDSSIIQVISPFLPDLSSRELSLPENTAHFFKCHDKVILLPGWAFSRLYNFELGIRILEKLRCQGINAGLIILNSGTEIDIGYKEQVYAEIQRTGTQNHTIFATDLPSLIPIYQKSDVLLRLTSHDGNSLSVQEAIYWGLPVIASDVSVRPKGTIVVSLDDFDFIFETVLKRIGKRSTEQIDREGSEGDMQKNIADIVQCYNRYFTKC